MIIYTGDLLHDLELTITDELDDGTPVPVNIDDALSVRVIGQRDGVKVIDRAPTSKEVIGNTSVVRMDWQAADTAIAGVIQFEVEVVWPGNKPQTFRATSYVDVVADFDLT